MDRPLAVGAAGGSVSALVFKLLADAVHSAAVPTAFLDCPLSDCTCPELDLSGVKLGPWDIKSVLVGVAIGLALGPCLDLLFVLRSAWCHWVRARLRDYSTRSTELYRLA